LQIRRSSARCQLQAKKPYLFFSFFRKGKERKEKRKKERKRKEKKNATLRSGEDRP
jgi:hypothetical protein